MLDLCKYTSTCRFRKKRDINVLWLSFSLPIQLYNLICNKFMNVKTLKWYLILNYRPKANNQHDFIPLFDLLLFIKTCPRLIYGHLIFAAAENRTLYFRKSRRGNGGLWFFLPDRNDTLCVSLCNHVAWEREWDDTDS